jgi:hypothetical protein
VEVRRRSTAVRPRVTGSRADGVLNLHLERVAELPQLLRRPGVLEENVINVERVKLAGTVTIDGLPNMGDKFPQLCLW